MFTAFLRYKAFTQAFSIGIQTPKTQNTNKNSCVRVEKSAYAQDLRHVRLIKHQ